MHVIVNNLSEKLQRACNKAAKGKRRSPAVAPFLVHGPSQRLLLEEELRSHRYRPGRGFSFWIKDPKPRCIFALPFRDRVVQHLLIDEGLASLERWFAPQSYACRRGKGTHRCLRRAAELASAKAYVLRIDIRKFFPSVDHALLRRILDPHTPKAWRWLRDRFLDAPVETERVAWHFPGDDLFTPHTRPHGLPIGSLTSQIWANAYLTPMDHRIGSHLGLGTFVRYCDDILVFDDNKARLQDALAHLEEMAHGLRLRLHPDKTRLHRTTDPVAFLGYVLQRTPRGVSVHLRQENVHRFRRRIKAVLRAYGAGAIPFGPLRARIVAWVAHASHGHTARLRRREVERLRLKA